MKFQSLKVDRFGSLANFELEFDVDAPMQVLFGPNEAGKSTLLGLIRELLFGFPHSGSEYHYSGTGRQIAAEARLVMSKPEHSTIHFRREKGTRSNQVHGEASPSGEMIDNTELLHRLGGISRPFYENVFGFSLGELTLGEKSLEEANLDEALYGTGLGGLKGLQAIRSELADETDRLWRPTGRNQKIHNLLNKVKETDNECRASMLRPDDYEARLQRYRETTESLDKVRVENEVSRRTLKHLERLSDALAPYQDLTATRRKLQKLDAESNEVISRFPRDGRRTMDELLREIHSAEQRLVEIDSQITEATARLDAIECRPAMVEQEPKIRQLFQTLKQIRDYRDEIPKLRHELETTQRQVLATINELDPSWTIEALDRYHLGIDRLTRIEEMSDEWNQLQEHRERNDERKAERQKNLEVNRSRLEAIASTIESAELLAIVDQQPDYVADRRKRQELEELLEGLHWKAEEAARKLFCVSGLDHEGLDQLIVPLEETVRAFDDRLKASDRAVREASERLRQTEETLNKFKADRDKLESTGSAPTLDQLEEARTLRNEGWQLLRRQYIELKKVPAKQFKAWTEAVRAASPASFSSLPSSPEVTAASEADLYESLVKYVDHLADERQDNAELVALLDELGRQIAAAVCQHEESREQLEAAQAVQSEASSEWHAIWEPCKISPLPPEAMLRWLENHGVYLAFLKEIQATESQANSVDRRIKRFEKELRRVSAKAGVLPSAEKEEKDSPSCSCETLLAAVKQHVERCRVSQANRQAIQNQLVELESERKQLDQESEELAKRADDWAKRWKTLLEDLGLPTDWTPKMADVTLGRLQEARRERQKIDPMEKRLGELDAQVGQFDRETRELCRQVADDLATLPPEQAVESLHVRLDKAKGDLIERRNVAERHETALQQKTTIESQLTALQKTRKTLLDTSGVASEAAFYEAACHVEEHQALLDEIRKQSDQIDRFITNEECADDFRKELEAIDADTFELKVQQARDDDRRITKEREEAAAEQCLAAEAIKELDRTDQAARVSADLESTRSELREAVDRWATLTVARALLDDAVQRFERENQPEMLSDIRRLFAMMTADRYTEVRRRMNERGELVVVQPDGTERVPSQLSTGTREQLYLAMRLAYVIHYCRRNEPLPLVMDDVLVNFDATRAAGTIDALAEVARSTQIIFLTCHQHTVDLIRTRLPNAPVCAVGYN